jgi:hypothetical protein
VALDFSSDILSLVAERKIQEAMAEGQFDNLPGRGQPQKLEDLSGLPEDLRLAYIVLKNSSYLDARPADTPNVRSMLADEPLAASFYKGLDKLKTRFKAAPGSKDSDRLDRLAQSPYLGSILDKIRS